MVCDRIHLMRDGSWLRHCSRGGVEREQWDALISLVQTHIVSDQMDIWLWSADGSGVFSVSMARVLINKGTLVIGEEETRWSKVVPIKINVFIWRMILDKLPTRLNLMLRGLDVQSNLCGICGTHIESIDHVMLHCQVASDLWRLIGRWWNLVIPVFISFKEFLSWLDNLNISSVSKKVFNVVVITAAWSIWRFRDEPIFGDTKPKKSILFDYIVSMAFYGLLVEEISLSSNDPVICWYITSLYLKHKHTIKLALKWILFLYRVLEVRIL
ncbi:RNA-directed DNA polymerase, eukaryota [Tanacetum coccineum]